MTASPPAECVFVYLANTLHGGEPRDGARPELLPELLTALTTWLCDHPEVDFVVHGGNLLARPEPSLMREAAAMLRLPVPVILCLGERDHPDASAEKAWLREAPALFPGGRVDLVHEAAGFDLCVMPIDNRNLAQLTAERDGRPKIICTHQPVLGKPAPGGGTIADRLLANNSVMAVLASPNLLDAEINRQGVPIVSGGSLVVPPFGFVEVRVAARSCLCVRHSLLELLPAERIPQLDSTYVSGKDIHSLSSRRRP